MAVKPAILLLTLSFSFASAQEVENFPPPTFQSNWMKLSSNPEDAFHKILHGLGQLPVLVKVLVKATDGSNQGYVFEAVGIGQTDDDLDDDRGGVIFAYTEQFVYIWVAIYTNDNQRSHTLLVGGSWGSGSHSQKSTDAEFQVLAWSSHGFYVPDFTSDSQTMGTSDYAEIQHGLGEIPGFVQVLGSFTDSGETFYFEGTGSQQSKYPRSSWEDGGGLMYAYSDKTVRIWTGRINIFTVADGYPKERGDLKHNTATIVVKAWTSFTGIRPAYETEWFDIDQSVTFHERDFRGCSSVRHVSVGILATDGKNKGFIFPAVGMSQLSGPRNNDEAGGVVFAYTQETVRLWTIDKSIAPTSGIVVVGWGDGTNQQRSSTGRVKIRVWCGNMTGMFKTKPDARSSSCQHFERVDADKARSSLVTLGLVTSVSFSKCLRTCSVNEVCTAASISGTDCKLYGKLQAGTGAEVSKDVLLFGMTGKTCDPCTER